MYLKMRLIFFVLFLGLSSFVFAQTKLSGKILNTQTDVTQYILDEAKLGLVPFSAFGSSDDSPWYRLSVGTCNLEEIPEVFTNLRKALSSLK